MNQPVACSVNTETLKEVKQISGWMLFKGILLLLLGIVGLGSPLVFTVVGVFLFGILVTIGGATQILYSFSSKSLGRIIINFLIGLLYLWIGVTAIFKPLEMSAILTFMIACVIMAVGVVRIVQALQHRGVRGWGWLLVSGILPVILGIIIASEWPISGLWVIGMFIAIELFFNGIASIALAVAVRSTGDIAEEAAPAPPTPEPKA